MSVVHVNEDRKEPPLFSVDELRLIRCFRRLLPEVRVQLLAVLEEETSPDPIDQAICRLKDLKGRRQKQTCGVE